jgi:hypothetical protein
VVACGLRGGVCLGRFGWRCVCASVCVPVCCCPVLSRLVPSGSGCPVCRVSSVAGVVGSSVGCCLGVLSFVCLSAAGLAVRGVVRVGWVGGW